MPLQVSYQASQQVIHVQLANRQSRLAFEPESLQQAVEAVLRGEGLVHAEVSIAVLDDAAIRELNRRYLAHDWETDVLSFVLEQDEHRLEGEIIVSADTAVTAGRRLGRGAQQELLLYVVHGALHLVGYDDHDKEDRRRMYAAEERHLSGIDPRAARSAHSDTQPSPQEGAEQA